MRGWIVLYSWGDGSILPKHYKTDKCAIKFAEEHRRNAKLWDGRQCEAVVVNVADLVDWINLGKDEIERMFRL